MPSRWSVARESDPKLNIIAKPLRVMFLTISSGQLKAQALDSTVRGIRRGLNIIKWLSIDSILQYKGMVAQFVAESQCYLCPECSYARSWLLRPTPRDCDIAADRGIECSFRGWCVV